MRDDRDGEGGDLNGVVVHGLKGPGEESSGSDQWGRIAQITPGMTQ